MSGGSGTLQYWSEILVNGEYAPFTKNSEEDTLNFGGSGTLQYWSEILVNGAAAPFTKNSEEDTLNFFGGSGNFQTCSGGSGTLQYWSEILVNDTVYQNFDPDFQNPPYFAKKGPKKLAHFLIISGDLHVAQHT